MGLGDFFRPLARFRDPQSGQLMTRTRNPPEIPPKVAQAAAWNISSGLSWQKLAAEVIDRPGGVPDQRYFTQAELFAARQVVGVVHKRVSGMQKTAPHRSSGER